MDFLSDTVPASGGANAAAVIAGASALTPYGAGLSLAGEALKNAAGGSAGPSNAASHVSSMFDASGFTVATGSARANGAGNLPMWAQWAMVAAAVAAVALMLWKK